MWLLVTFFVCLCVTQSHALEKQSLHDRLHYITKEVLRITKDRGEILQLFGELETFMMTRCLAVHGVENFKRVCWPDELTGDQKISNSTQLTDLEEVEAVLQEQVDSYNEFIQYPPQEVDGTTNPPLKETHPSLLEKICQAPNPCLVGNQKINGEDCLSSDVFDGSRATNEAHFMKQMNLGECECGTRHNPKCS
jgi:hypothetical protein